MMQCGGNPLHNARTHQKSSPFLPRNGAPGPVSLGVIGSFQGSPRMKLKRLFQVLVLGGTTLVAACGGGGGGRQPRPPHPPPPRGPRGGGGGGGGGGGRGARPAGGG